MDAELARWSTELAGASERTRLAMAVYAVSLGVECAHCHVQGDRARVEKASMRLVPRMSAMFNELPKYMPPTARTQCYMCHKGSTRPERKPS